MVNHNENGFTLIEVIVTIAILSMITVLATNTIVNIDKNEVKTQNVITLQQDTKILVDNMRNNYHDGSGIGELTFTVPDNITIDSLKLNDVSKNTTSPIDNVNFDEPLDVTITTINENNTPIIIRTTWQPMN